MSKYVMYSTIIKDDRFMSIHDRTGLTDEQAQHRFMNKHRDEVQLLIREKLENENNKSKADDCRIIRNS